MKQTLGFEFLKHPFDIAQGSIERNAELAAEGFRNGLNGLPAVFPNDAGGWVQRMDCVPIGIIDDKFTSYFAGKQERIWQPPERR